MHHVIYGSHRYCSRHSCSQRCYCRTLLSCTYLSTMLDLAMLLGGFYLFLLLHWKVSVGRDCSRRRCVRCCYGRNAASPAHVPMLGNLLPCILLGGLLLSYLQEAGNAAAAATATAETPQSPPLRPKHIQVRGGTFPSCFAAFSLLLCHIVVLPLSALM